EVEGPAQDRITDLMLLGIFGREQQLERGPGPRRELKGAAVLPEADFGHREGDQRDALLVDPALERTGQRGEFVSGGVEAVDRRLGQAVSGRAQRRDARAAGDGE